MTRSILKYTLLVACVAAVPLTGAAADDASSDTTDANAQHIASTMKQWAKPAEPVTEGKVTVGGQTIAYKAVAGTLTLHGQGDQEAVPTAGIFYTAYFKKGVQPGMRPVTFVYNGGPGSSSLWLHMGAFEPKRVQTSDDSHTPAAPYKLVNNDYSLLDVTDLVFIDALGTGFSRLIAEGKDPSARQKLMKKRQKQFYSVDGDAEAFAQFISQFLSTYDRWNSPKYLFSESYGTTRSAVLANDLHNHDSIDVNGVILLSQILNFDDSIDEPETNPGVDLAYVLALFSYAATAWYHHKLPYRPPPAQVVPAQG